MKATPVADAHVEVEARLVFRRDYQEVGDLSVDLVPLDQVRGNFVPLLLSRAIRGERLSSLMRTTIVSRFLIEVAGSCLSSGHRDRKMASFMVLLV